MVAFQKEQLIPKNFPKDEPIIKEKEVTTTDAKYPTSRICFALQNIIE